MPMNPYVPILKFTSAGPLRMQRVQRFVSVRALINSSICKLDEVLYICVIHVCDEFLVAELAEIMKLCML